VPSSFVHTVLLLLYTYAHRSVPTSDPSVGRKSWNKRRLMMNALLYWKLITGALIWSAVVADKRTFAIDSSAATEYLAGTFLRGRKAGCFFEANVLGASNGFFSISCIRAPFTTNSTTILRCLGKWSRCFENQRRQNLFDPYFLPRGRCRGLLFLPKTIIDSFSRDLSSLVTTSTLNPIVHLR